ncbi:kinase-like domain-containing protein [Melanogaster broomeanus]|nr:kinase-like domain-containing protein [Melanogaster broomeanus]
MELDRSIQHGAVVSFAMELLSTDLATYMRSESDRCRRHACRWMAQIALGIESLHEMGIMHRDIKTENILVDARQNVRIADFGLAHVENKPLHRWGEYASEVSGTPQCMAPEMLQNKGMAGDRMKRYGMAVDWWALGCLLFELESKRHQQLFACEKEVYGYVSWTKRHCRLTQIYPKFEGLRPAAASLLQGLLRISPSLRYSIWEIEKHEYFLRRNGTNEFVDAGVRALERAVRPELVPQSMFMADKPIGSIPGTRQRLRFDWKNPKFGVES